MWSIIKRNLALLLAVFLTIAFPAIAFSETAYIERETNISFPANLGNLKFQGTFKYKDPALGVSIRYSGRNNLKADVYVYNLGILEIGNNSVSGPVAQQMVQALGEITMLQKKGYYKNIRPRSKTGKLTVEVRNIGKFSFLSTRIAFMFRTPETKNFQSAYSWIYLTSRSDNFIKVRITSPASNSKDIGKDIDDFMLGLSKLLKS